MEDKSIKDKVLWTFMFVHSLKFPPFIFLFVYMYKMNLPPSFKLDRS